MKKAIRKYEKVCVCEREREKDRERERERKGNQVELCMSED